MVDKRRLQFDFTLDALEELDELQRKTGFSSRADLIRHALRFFQWAIEETQSKKAHLLIEKDGVTRELVIPSWNSMRRDQKDEELTTT